MADIRNYIFAERKRVIDIALQCDLTVICEKKELRGYQIYIVEQWVCDRNEPSNIVKVFTGDDSHVIQVAIIGIPVSLLRNPTLEIKRLLNDSSHLKLKPTPDGEIMLVDLTELRFDRDPILVPNGDYDACITQAYVNINLRRTNCTGRISLTLLSPNPTSEEKFRSSYKIADAAEFNDAVINLVKLVQKSLFLFGLLKEDYIDGLICNETKVALWIFHSQYGPVKSIDFSGKEPWLEPHLMASIVSKLLVCRNKLQDLNFTNVKDPFTDYNAFREDIGNYQKYKDIALTKFIDLETLTRLNEHSYSQLNVRKVFKSKLDDISGISNSPLFIETSDPETFKYHATIESLRSIWRPKLKGKANKAAETTLGKISRVTKFPWMNTTDSKKTDKTHLLHGSIPNPFTSQSNNNRKSTPTADPALDPSSFNPLLSLSIPEISLPSIPYPTLRLPPQPPVPIITTPYDHRRESYEHPFQLRSSMSPTHINLDIPTCVPVRLSESDDMDDRLEPEASTSADIYAHLRRNNGGDFDRYDMNGHKHKRHNRSSSDTILSRPTYLRGRSSVNQLESVHQERVEDMGETYRKERSNSFNEEVVSRGPTVSIDIHTYMTYEKLCTRQEELKIAYNEVSKLANIYESMVDSLKETYDKRSKEFQGIEVDVKAVMDEQSRTEKRVQEAEEKSSKLLYDMKGLSDKLKEIEDSVGSFYMKVGNLEQKMDHSQESITIVGNYFNHYWIKMKEWFDWLNVNK